MIKKIMEDAGVPDLVVTRGKVKYLNTEMVDCDLYRMQAGDPAAIEKFTGSYLRRIPGRRRR